jgi:hypothetical protein
MISTRFTFATLCGVALLAGVSSAIGGGVSSPLCFNDQINLQTTNWNQSVSVSKFDPALGILTRVELTLKGDVVGSASIESLDAGASTVTTDYQAAISLTRPDLSILLVSTPTAHFVDNLTAFDGVVDFAGTSGTQHLNISKTTTELMNSVSAMDLALFTGPAGNPGNIVLPVDALGSSNATGSGNLITQFMTDAGATVDVCYFFLPDCNGNGIADERDVAAHGASNDGDNNGIPDECEPGIRTFCDGDGAQNGGLDCPCGNNGAPGEGCLNSSGQGGLLTATGNPSVSNDTVVLTASQVPTISHGFFLFSLTQPGVGNSGNGAPFGHGIRCISNPGFVRKVINGGVAPGPNMPSLSAMLGISAGDTTYWQFWFRDIGGPCGPGTNNATNGIEIVWGL